MLILGIQWLSHANLRMGFILWLFWSLHFTDANGQSTDTNEVDALQSIRKSLIDPFRNLASWHRGDPCISNWKGINCYDTALDDGQYHVKELTLSNKNLSGTLSPELAKLSHLKILDFMWNNISGTIPKEIGQITTLELLLLNGNQLTGSLPEELGALANLDRIQIDQNQISGPLPASFVNMSKAQHFHMNNNSISGQIPREFGQLPSLVHLLLDNNNLSGPLPPELSDIPNLSIFQLDNNNLSGTTIPSSYGNMSHLVKLSLRNCSLQGLIPDWSNLPDLAYIDLSFNQLNGSIPTGPLSQNITTIDLTINNLNGTIPDSFTGLTLLQKLSVANNSLSGSVSALIWQNRTLNSTERVIINFEYNRFSNLSGIPLIPPNITVGLQGNPVCRDNSVSQLCRPQPKNFGTFNTSYFNSCPSHACPAPFEYAPPSPDIQCFCAAPIFIGYRLKSPGFSDFLPYVDAFKEFLNTSLNLTASQLDIDSFAWEEGPRLRMYLKIFPAYVNDSVRSLNRSEVLRIRDMFGGWRIHNSEFLGPYEFLNFTLSEPYIDEFPPSKSGISKGALAGIIIGTLVGSFTIAACVSIPILRLQTRKRHSASKRRPSSRISIKIDGVKNFTYAEMAMATKDFDNSTVVGRGGYGKVYRGILADETVVAIKRAQEGSLQGEKEFLTEIELLSRLHHRNLVSLLGYCDEEDEQMLVYEFMPNGTLRDHLSGRSKMPMSFEMRVKVALGFSKGILYLHTEADPPIFHRDIKSSNILLDSKFVAKVADFGLSRLAPVPDLEGALPAHVSTIVKGTPGYLDPEYFLTHKLTDKSDVYSLGVVFLELLTGLHPIFDGKNIVREVNIAYRSGMMFSIIDDRMGSYPSECIEKFINLALKCCQDETDNRPSMTEVVRELENIGLMMPESDTKISESLFTDSSSGRVTPPPSSASSSIKTPFVWQDVSSSDLFDGAAPTIAPR